MLVKMGQSASSELDDQITTMDNRLKRLENEFAELNSAHKNQRTIQRKLNQILVLQQHLRTLKTRRSRGLT
jgi:chaperonin cofactor prefoldin